MASGGQLAIVQALLQKFDGLCGKSLVAGFGRAGRLRREVAFAQFAVEEIEDQAVQTVGEFGVVAQAFVAHEGVGAVDLVPA